MLHRGWTEKTTEMKKKDKHTQAFMGVSFVAAFQEGGAASPQGRSGCRSGKADERLDERLEGNREKEKSVGLENFWGRKKVVWRTSNGIFSSWQNISLWWCIWDIFLQLHYDLKLRCTRFRHENHLNLLLDLCLRENSAWLWGPCSYILNYLLCLEADSEHVLCKVPTVAESEKTQLHSFPLRVLQKEVKVYSIHCILWWVYNVIFSGSSNHSIWNLSHSIWKC